MAERSFSDFALDRKAVRRAFDRASATFDRAAVLHREVRQRALERLLLLRQPPEQIVDLGSGTGEAREWFAEQFPRAHIISLDSSQEMLGRQRGSLWKRLIGSKPPRVCADGAAIPLREHSVDWVFSSLMLPWCAVDAVFAEVRRILKPGGVFCFTTLGPDTLREMRNAWAQVDRHEHVHSFSDMHDLGDALIRAGFSEPVLDVERIVLTYADLPGLHRDLKAIGGGNALANRSHGLMGRRTRAHLLEAYETHRHDGALPATFEIIYGQAWQSLRSRGRTDPPGEVVVPLDRLRRRTV